MERGPRSDQTRSERDIALDIVAKGLGAESVDEFEIEVAEESGGSVDITLKPRDSKDQPSPR